jgi:DUF1680 family protein
MLQAAHSAAIASAAITAVLTLSLAAPSSAGPQASAAQQSSPAPQAPAAKQSPPAPQAPPPQAPGQPAAPGAQQPEPAHGPGPLQKNLTPVPASKVHLIGGFWSERLETIRTVSLPAVLKKCEDTGRIQNFAIAAGKAQGKHQGRVYDDSDVYKAIEGAAWCLGITPDPALGSRIDALVDTIASAQDKDGYLDTAYQIAGDDGKTKARWTDIKDGHELYCAGHLIEAAVALQKTTGKTKLLDVAKKLADHIDKTFGPGKKMDVPGHPEIELALCKLAEATEEKRYTALAKFFVDQRGAKGHTSHGEFAQDHKPLREQTEAVGHAVRAMYLYTGAADVARMTEDDTLIAPLETLWKDVVENKMYVTGGIGSSKENEGFTAAHDLPNDTAYCETCASIGMAMFSQRLALATGDARYADVVDTEIHNAILAGLSMKGDLFSYDNPLESRGDFERKDWFDTACCPTNVVRFLPQLPGMIFATSGNTIYVLQYVPCKADIEIAGVNVHLQIDTDWPFKSAVSVKIEPEKQMTFGIKFRRPQWCKQVAYEHDLKEREHYQDYPGTDAGWEAYERRYDPNDGCVIALLGPVRRVTAPDVAADRDRVAIVRGSVVFALEGLDQEGGSAHAMVLPDSVTSMPVFDKPDKKLNTIRAVKAKGQRVVAGPGGKLDANKADLLFVPYFLWGNRGKSDMIVWVPTKPDLARPAGQ